MEEIEAAVPETETAEQPDTPEAVEPKPPDEVAVEEVTADQLLPPEEQAAPPPETDETRLRAVIEAIVYLTDQPLSVEQISAALAQPRDRVTAILTSLVAEYDQPGHGIAIREVAGGFSMATKAEHHEEVRQFVKNLQPPVKLSLPALETLAVIAYKQPITAPEVMEIRGVQGTGVLKTLLDRKLIAASGRKSVVGKPILYKTTREFLVQFGLKVLAELPSLKEFEEIRRMSVPDEAPPEPVAAEPTPPEPEQPEPEQTPPPAEPPANGS